MKRFAGVTMALVFLAMGFCFNANVVASEKVKLVAWQITVPGAWEGTHRELVDKYMGLHPDVEIAVESVGSHTDLNTKLKLAIATGRGPDIVMYWHDVGAYPWFKADFLSPMPDYLQDYMEEYGLTKSVMDTARTRDGEFYGVPTGWSGTVVFYNKDMLAEAGLSVPPEDWDWDMLMDYARKLTKYDSGGEVTQAGLSLRKTGHPHGTVHKWGPFFFSAGVPTELTYWTEDLTKTIINSSPAREALQFYLDAIYKYKVDSLELAGDFRGFGERRVAMFHRGYQFGLFFKVYAPDVSFGIAHVPQKEFPQFASSMISSQLSLVTKDSKHPDEAWKYLHWFIQPEQNGYVAERLKATPPYKNTAQMKFFQTDPNYRIALSQRARAEAHITNIYELDMIIGEYIERVCYRKLSIDEALKAAEKELNELLK